jgi:hypothetical protein
VAVTGRVVLGPVAGIGEHQTDAVGDPDLFEGLSDGVDHRLVEADVVGVVRDVAGDDDLAVVDRCLGVVALHPAGGALHDA